MTEKRKPAAAGAAVTGPTPRRRRRLSGVAYYLVYVPALFVAAFSALLFTALVEHYVLNDE